MTRTSLLPAFAVLLALSACGGADPSGQDDATADAGEAATAEAHDTADTATTAAEAASALTADNLDAVERGLARENALLEQAIAEMAGAGSDDEKLDILTRTANGELETEAAAVAGLALDRYRDAKDTLHEVLGAVQMRASLEKQFADMDTEGLDEATAASMRENAEAMKASIPDPYERLDAGLAEALRARETALAGLSAANIGLRLKLAGL